MQERLLEFVFDLGRRRGRWVLGFVIATTLAGAALATRTRISTSQRDLVPATHPVQQDYQAFVREFGAADSLIAVLDGEPALLKPAADELAAELRLQTALVKSVFFKIDLALLRDRAPLYLTLPQLEELRARLAQQRPLIEQASRIHNLPDLVAAIDQGFARPELALDPVAVNALLAGLRGLFSEWRGFVSDPARRDLGLPAGLLAAGAEVPAVVRSGGYLTSRDGRLLFLFVQPTSASDDATFLRPLLSAVRAAGERVLRRHPEWQGKVKLALTGLPAHVLTETDTVFSDVGNGMVLAVVLILGVVLVGFRTLRKTALAVIPLVCGMVTGLGLVILVLGRLNLVSAAFMAVMFGMSIDFGIYLVRRAEEELGRGADLPAAVRIAMVRTGKGVLTGGLTTCAAFVAITLSDFAGFAELGITAGIGIFVCLVDVFLLFPVLALRIGLEPRQPRLHRVEERARGPWARPTMFAAAATVAGLCVLAAWVSPRLSFDYDALALLPRDTESTEYQQRMQRESDFQVSTVMVTADSLHEMRELTAHLQALPEVSRVESLADVIPGDQEAKLVALAGLRPLLGDLAVTFVPAAGSASEIRPSRVGSPPALPAADHRGREWEPSEGSHIADKLAARFAEAEEQAFTAGKADVVERIGAVLQEIAGLRQQLDRVGVERAQARTRVFEQALFDGARAGLALLRTWLAARPVGESDLAPELLARFKSPAGHYVAYVTPRGSIWDVAFLDRFVGKLKQITPRVTGFPVTHQVYSRMVVRGFRQAMVYAFFAVVVLLALDFRRVHAVLLALLPLGLGFLLLQLLVWVAGVRYNYANIAAFPVLMGYGVSFGVNMVQRWMEDPSKTAFVAAATIGKGVVLSASTALAGLGSIAFARHRGVSTFGFLLLGSITLCLLLATLVLPVVIDLIYQRRGTRNVS
jgi:hopanoid biosynthesis associated RND transporter like protein HpnN